MQIYFCSDKIQMEWLVYCVYEHVDRRLSPLKRQIYLLCTFTDSTNVRHFPGLPLMLLSHFYCRKETPSDGNCQHIWRILQICSCMYLSHFFRRFFVKIFKICRYIWWQLSAYLLKFACCISERSCISLNAPSKSLSRWLKAQEPCLRWAQWREKWKWLRKNLTK